MGMHIQMDEKKLIITIDVDNNRSLSKSGKSRTVASTGGNVKTGVMVDGKELVVGVNAYIPA